MITVLSNEGEGGGVLVGDGADSFFSAGGIAIINGISGKERGNEEEEEEVEEILIARVGDSETRRWRTRGDVFSKPSL